MKTVLFLMLLGLSNMSMASLESECRASFLNGVDEYNIGVNETHRTEESRLLVNEAATNDDVEKFCAEGSIFMDHSYRAMDHFTRARQSFGEAYYVCSSPNDDNAKESSDSAMEIINQLLTIREEIGGLMAEHCQ